MTKFFTNPLRSVFFTFQKKIIYFLKISLFFLFAFLFSNPGSLSASDEEMTDDAFFTLQNGINLREAGGRHSKMLLKRVHGRGKTFGKKEKIKYCKLKMSKKEIQWVLNDLTTGEIISRSDNADVNFFGASSAKIFVAATLLQKQEGHINKQQLKQMASLIIKSSNPPWKELQRQAGEDGTDDSGREAVNQFVQQMGYTNTKGFQGWWKKKDGTKIHGNELNTIELARFLHDTYHQKYKGAEFLWKIMHATTTGKNKINKYTPKHIYIGGKTGTYHGSNESPKTIKLKSIKARNHVAMLKIKNKYYGLSILCNTGNDEDVAILSGGLMREYLDIGDRFSCEHQPENQ